MSSIKRGSSPLPLMKEPDPEPLMAAAVLSLLDVLFPVSVNVKFNPEDVVFISSLKDSFARRER